MAPISLLLVDDHPAFRRIATNFLETQSKEKVVVVASVGGGEEALAQALNLQPDIVLCDLAMPSPNGLETIARLRAALPELGIIALSLHDASGYRQAALAAGADEFAPKASMTSELLPAILRVMQTRQGREKRPDANPVHNSPHPSLLPSGEKVEGDFRGNISCAPSPPLGMNVPTPHPLPHPPPSEGEGTGGGAGRDGAGDFRGNDAMSSGAVDYAVQSPVIKLVVFDIEGQHYALPLHAVERVLPMVAVSPLPQAPAVVLGVINLHGQVIPVLDLRRRFGLPLRDYGLTARLLVVRTSRRILALAVNEVLGVREVAPETITRPDALLPGIGHVAGIVALADGLLFIHDVEACLSLDEEQRLTTALEEVEA